MKLSESRSVASAITRSRNGSASPPSYYLRKEPYYCLPDPSPSKVLVHFPSSLLASDNTLNVFSGAIRPSSLQRALAVQGKCFIRAGPHTQGREPMLREALRVPICFVCSGRPHREPCLLRWGRAVSCNSTVGISWCPLSCAFTDRGETW